jgi:uncharacterized protein YbcI
MSTTTPEEHSDKFGSGSQAASISNAIVQLHRRRYGKGPTKAKTFMLNDVVVCVYEGGVLPIEETLRDHGHTETVHQVRREFQIALDQEFRRIIEEETGRGVRVFLSQFDSENDVGAEIFFLEP